MACGAYNLFICPVCMIGREVFVRLFEEPDIFFGSCLFISEFPLPKYYVHEKISPVYSV